MAQRLIIEIILKKTQMPTELASLFFFLIMYGIYCESLYNITPSEQEGP